MLEDENYNVQDHDLMPVDSELYGWVHELFGITHMLTPTTMAVKLLHEDAQVPTRGSPAAAGLDLYAYIKDQDGKTSYTCLEPGERAVIHTGVAIDVPYGFYGRVAPRSGLAVKNGLDVLAGVVDADYRGEVCVVLINLGNAPYCVEHGQRVAQLIIERAAIVDLIVMDELPETDRGEGGFGSTGK